MNESTTKGEKMDKERIAELRRMAYGCMGGRMYSQPIMDELLDALEAALARAEGAELISKQELAALNRVWYAASTTVSAIRERGEFREMEDLTHAIAHLDAIRDSTEPRP